MKPFGIFIKSLVLVPAILLASCSSGHINGKTLSSCATIKPSGKIVSKTYRFDEINAIDLSGIQDVIITQGTPQKVEVKASENIMKYTRIEYRDGELSIGMTSNSNRHQNYEGFDAIVYVTVRDLDRIVSTGVGDIECKGTFRTGKLYLKLNGTGDIDIPSLKCTDITTELNGTGDITIKGSATTARIKLNGTGDTNISLTGASELSAIITGTGDINASGSVRDAVYNVTGTGDIYARKMEAKNVKATANGTGDITCYASEEFTGSCSSIPHITCYGKPKNRNYRNERYSFPD